MRRAIDDAIGSFEEVQAVIAVLTMQLGPDSILVTGEINVRDDLRTDEIEQLIHRIEAKMRTAVPTVRNVYLELHPVPDKERPGERRRETSR